MSTTHQVTQAVNQVGLDPAADRAAFARVYDDLLRIARAELSRHRRGETLNTRALVSESYLKLFAGQEPSFENRRHFFASAAMAMRQVIIDHARAKLAERRGSGVAALSLDALEGAPLAVEAQAEHLVAIDEALRKLERLDPRLVKIAELRFFAGMEVKDIADLLGISAPTIKRDTRAAKAFLARELGVAP